MIKKIKISARVRSIIIALLCLALLVGAALAVTFWPESKDKGEGSSSSASTSSEQMTELGYLPVYSYKQSQVRDISVENTLGGFNFKYVGEESWQLQEVKVAPKDAEELEDIILSATEFAATKLVAENPTDFKSYGLENPLGKVKITYSTGEELVAHIGDTNASGSVYVYLVNNDKIYVTDPGWSEPFLLKYTAYIDLSIVDPLETDEDGNDVDPHVTKITYTGKGVKNPIVIEENPEYVTQREEIENNESGTTEATVNAAQFMFTSPMVADISNDAFESKQYEYYGLQATDIYVLKPTSADLAKCGLSTPYVTISITDKNGVTKINLGNKVTIGDNEYYYVTSSVKTPIFIVEASNFTFFEEDLIDYMSAIVVNVMIDDIKTLTVEMDGKKYVFEESGEGEELIARYNGKKLSTSEYRDFYQLVMLVLCEESVEPGQYKGDPELKITYTYREREKVDVIEYVKVATRKYMIRRNGSDLALVRSKYVDTLKYGIGELIAGRDVPSDY